MNLHPLYGYRYTHTALMVGFETNCIGLVFYTKFLGSVVWWQGTPLRDRVRGPASSPQRK